MAQDRFVRFASSFAGMSDAVMAPDGTLYASGVVALKNGELVGDGDPTRQAEQCFENLAAVLDAASLGFEDVLMLRCYLTDAAYYPAYAEVKNRLFGRAAPASTGLVVKSLLLEGLLMEVEATAYAGPLRGAGSEQSGRRRDDG
ncbi:MAG: enamine deaminase RidA [Halioglobus sp.]|nr:enamine deaminase RidA [Halioglobus sp.]